MSVDAARRMRPVNRPGYLCLWAACGSDVIGVLAGEARFTVPSDGHPRPGRGRKPREISRATYVMKRASPEERFSARVFRNFGWNLQHALVRMLELSGLLRESLAAAVQRPCPETVNVPFNQPVPGERASRPLILLLTSPTCSLLSHCCPSSAARVCSAAEGLCGKAKKTPRWESRQLRIAGPTLTAIQFP